MYNKSIFIQILEALKVNNGEEISDTKSLVQNMSALESHFHFCVIKYKFCLVSGVCWWSRNVNWGEPKIYDLNTFYCTTNARVNANGRYENIKRIISLPFTTGVWKLRLNIDTNLSIHLCFSTQCPAIRMRTAKL